MIKNVIQSSSSSELIEIMTTNNCQNDLFNHSNKHNDHSLLMNGFIHKMRERTKIFPNIYDYEVKVIILGERRVGKSRFMYRLQHDKFLASDAKNDDFGFGLCSKIVINQRRQYVKGVIWSCSFESSAYFKNADGVILMFDLTRKSSFDDLYKSVHKMKEFCIPNVKCILLGTKCDLIHLRQVSRNEAENYANSLGIPYFESSDRNGESIELAVTCLLKEIPENIHHKPCLDNSSSPNTVEMNYWCSLL